MQSKSQTFEIRFGFGWKWVELLEIVISAEFFSPLPFSSLYSSMNCSIHMFTIVYWTMKHCYTKLEEASGFWEAQIVLTCVAILDTAWYILVWFLLKVQTRFWTGWTPLQLLKAYKEPALRVTWRLFWVLWASSCRMYTNITAFRRDGRQTRNLIAAEDSQESLTSTLSEENDCSTEYKIEQRPKVVEPQNKLKMAYKAKGGMKNEHKRRETKVQRLREDKSLPVRSIVQLVLQTVIRAGSWRKWGGYHMKREQR